MHSRGVFLFFTALEEILRYSEGGQSYDIIIIPLLNLLISL